MNLELLLLEQNLNQNSGITFETPGAIDNRNQTAENTEKAMDIGYLVFSCFLFTSTLITLFFPSILILGLLSPIFGILWNLFDVICGFILCNYQFKKKNYFAAILNMFSSGFLLVTTISWAYAKVLAVFKIKLAALEWLGITSSEFATATGIIAGVAFALCMVMGYVIEKNKLLTNKGNQQDKFLDAWKRCALITILSVSVSIIPCFSSSGSMLTPFILNLAVLCIFAALIFTGVNKYIILQVHRHRDLYKGNQLKPLPTWCSRYAWILCITLFASTLVSLILLLSPQILETLPVLVILGNEISVALLLVGFIFTGFSIFAMIIYNSEVKDAILLSEQDGAFGQQKTDYRKGKNFYSEYNYVRPVNLDDNHLSGTNEASKEHNQEQNAPTAGYPSNAG